MEQNINRDQIGAMAPAMGDAIRSCVHCGFCLAACPTYRELGQEMDSPRGRILLMKQVLEGELEQDQAQPYIDKCLGCLACEPACPSGVEYRNLISPFRAVTEPRRKRGVVQRVQRALVGSTLPYPGRFRAALHAARWLRPVRALVPPSFRGMLELAPTDLPPREVVAGVYPPPPHRERRARVGLLAGCAQQALAPEINRATIEVLNREGVEVVVPGSQACCGALSWHVGDLENARAFAVRNIAAFSDAVGVDAVVTNAAGCGSGMHEYGLILKGTPDEEAGAALAKRVVDVCAFLDQLGELEPIPDPGGAVRIAYHDACHLSNGQGVRAEPRRLLSRIPGIQLSEIRDAELCCGSAGTYNIDQPEVASSLGRRKAEAVIETRPTVVATGNIGCLIQLSSHLRKLGSNVPVRHTVEVLNAAARGHLMAGR